jgi:tetratricopeptide (TPR) repeat protein
VADPVTATTSRRAQLLEAAAVAFGRRGYAAVGLGDIAAAVGISAPALYRHFPGKYALFAVPAREKWQIVVNSQADQWGAYFRDAKKDVLSFDVTPVAGPEEEWLEFRIEPASKNALRVEMAWEKLRVAFPVEFDVTGIVWKNIDAAIAAADPKDYKTLYQAAKYAFQSGERKEKAAGWLDEAMKRGQSFWMDELKGDLLAEAGKYREAIPYVEKAIEGSKKAGAPDAWRDGARKKIDGWREKMKDGMKG